MRKQKKTRIERKATPLFELVKPVSLGGAVKIRVFFPSEQQPKELLIKCSFRQVESNSSLDNIGGRLT